MNFILYSFIVMLLAMTQTHDAYAMEKKAVTPSAKVSTPSLATPATLQHAKTSAPTTVDVDITLITLFDYPDGGSCSNFKSVQSKKPKRVAMDPEKTLNDYMSQFEKDFKTNEYYPLSFSKDGGSNKIPLSTMVKALGATHIFAHKYKKLPQPPQPGEGE